MATFIFPSSHFILETVGDPLFNILASSQGCHFPGLSCNSFWNLPCKKIIVFHDILFWENSQNYNKWWLKYYLWSIIAGLNGQSKIISASLATEKNNLY